MSGSRAPARGLLTSYESRTADIPGISSPLVQPTPSPSGIPTRQIIRCNVRSTRSPLSRIEQTLPAPDPRRGVPFPRAWLVRHPKLDEPEVPRSLDGGSVGPHGHGPRGQVHLEDRVSTPPASSRGARLRVLPRGMAENRRGVRRRDPYRGSYRRKSRDLVRRRVHRQPRHGGEGETRLPISPPQPKRRVAYRRRLFPPLSRLVAGQLDVVALLHRHPGEGGRNMAGGRRNEL